VGASRRSYPRFRREGDGPVVELTDDDVAIIRSVYRHRFVRADDLYRLFPGCTPDRISRRLTALYRSGFLDRPIAQIDRFRPGGSQALVYGLDTAGARLLKEQFGVSLGVANWKSRNRSYTRESLGHTLAVSRFLIDVKLACRTRVDLTYIDFEEILHHAPEETKRSPFPGRWPVDLRFRGARGTVYLIPDAIFGLRLRRPDGTTRTSYLFVEVDRGTMTIAPSERVQESDAFIHRATILRKLAAYAESFHEGLHKKYLGISAPRMLLLTTSAGRAEAIRRAASQLLQSAWPISPGAMIFSRLVEHENPLDGKFTDAAGTKTSLLPLRHEETANV
jgi:hypothetical protein